MVSFLVYIFILDFAFCATIPSIASTSTSKVTDMSNCFKVPKCLNPCQEDEFCQIIPASSIDSIDCGIASCVPLSSVTRPFEDSQIRSRPSYPSLVENDGDDGIALDPEIARLVRRELSRNDFHDID